MVTNNAKPVLVIERDGLEIALPDPEPNAVRTRLSRCSNTFAHQVMSHTSAVPRARNVDPMELRGPNAWDATRRVCQSELCEPD